MTIHLRDVVRFLVFFTLFIVLDEILFRALGLPRDTEAESSAMALGFTLLCAIREPVDAPLSHRVQP